MLRLATKLLLCIEIVVCFAPVLLLLLLGVLMVPFQIVAVNHEPLLWRGPATLIASVVCGGIGLLTLLFVLGKLFVGRKPVGSPWLICTGVALGALPIVPIAIFGDTWGWKFAGALPLAASAHCLFLARGLLFSSWRHALRSVATAAAVVLLLHAVSAVDPFHASGRVILAQRQRWEESAPDRYAFTIRVNGWLRPEDLSAKRIVVENGEVVSAKYMQSAAGRKAGDPAPLENLWTIERAFAELLEAEAQGASVAARFDLRWGFAERVFVETEETRSDWDLEITEFKVLREAAE
jgi:hypothetical protein